MSIVNDIQIYQDWNPDGYIFRRDESWDIVEPEEPKVKRSSSPYIDKIRARMQAFTVKTGENLTIKTPSADAFRRQQARLLNGIFRQ